jgi:ribose transport system permease protein
MTETQTTETNAAEETELEVRKRELLRFRSSSYIGIWVATGALFILCAIFASDSMSAVSLNAMIPFAALLAIVSIGQTLVIQQRGIDLSVPGMITFVGMSFVTFVEKSGASTIVALLVMLGVAALFGLANGLIITRINVTPLITTLAMNALLVGAMYGYTNGVASSAPDGLSAFTNDKLLGVSVMAWIAVGLMLVVGFISMQTPIGRRFVAVGANPAAARALGVRVDAYIVGSYVLAAMFFAFAGVLLTGYIKTPTPLLGEPYLFLSVIAVVIGGTSVAGGRGSVSASVVAALFLTQLAAAGRALGAPASTQQLIQAIAMTGAVGLGALIVARKARNKSIPDGPPSPPAAAPGTPAVAAGD